MKELKLIVANRGEIAVRILSSANKLGLQTVSVYTAVDATAPHVRLADTSVEIGNYIDKSELLKVCQDHEVDLLHPGYGFLSEDPDFCDQVEKAGITWLGPQAEQIRKMGLKHEARVAALAADVPVVPGSGLLLSVKDAVAQGSRIGFPIMLKATGGGGGMGMIRCNDEDEIRDAYDSVVQTGANLFSNAGVFLEKMILRARHIEIQVFGDGQGQVVDFGERECSAQRRNQKLLEEAPSPFILQNPDIGHRMRQAALDLCTLINYRSAGTVEFIVDDSTGEFYFLELNSRIQVEHAVTEMVRPGLDLVCEMITLGVENLNGRSPSLERLRRYSEATGHAIEARIYAEIAHLNFKPAPGLLQKVVFPKEPWIRIDTWVSSGTTISPFYDPMIAKVICHGKDRDESRRHLLQALSETTLAGTSSNLYYLQSILRLDLFVQGNITTNFLNTFAYTEPVIEIIDGGLSTTVQDCRYRNKGDGIPRGGSADDVSAKIANLLVGNDLTVEVLEATLTGPKFKVSTNAIIAVTGALVQIEVDGQEQPMWTAIKVKAGSTIDIGQCLGSGMRVYIAIAGGFPDVGDFLGSKSTFIGGNFGGYQGRALLAGDIIRISDKVNAIGQFRIRDLPNFSTSWRLSVLIGPHGDASYLTGEDLDVLFDTKLIVAPSSNRQGIRLDGLPPLKYARSDGGEGGSHASNTIDHGYVVGTLNMNGDTAVVFGTDGPDAGGYCCPVAVASIDIWKLGQIRPGDSVQLVPRRLSDVLAEVERRTNALKTCMSSVTPLDVAQLYGPNDLDREVERSRLVEGSIVQRKHNKFIHGDVSYRQFSDQALLVELGRQLYTFRVRALAGEWERRIRQAQVPGVITVLQGAASIVVKFDPSIVSQNDVVSFLDATLSGIEPDFLESRLPSRRVHLPIVFNDARTLQVVGDYMVSSGRQNAVYLPNNLAYVAQSSGYEDVDTFAKAFVRSDWFVFARAFFCGLPMMVPLDERSKATGQKYNPSRTMTPAGTIGYAGSSACIYPIDSPGGVQMLGRSISPWKQHADQYEDHFLLKEFDMVRWVPMTESEFSVFEHELQSGKRSIQVEETSISVAEVEKQNEKYKEEIEARVQVQKVRAIAMAKEEQALYAVWTQSQRQDKVDTGTSFASAHVVTSPLPATVRAIHVTEGDESREGDVLVKLEAMKTEITVSVDKITAGRRILSINVAPGDIVQAGGALLRCSERINE